MQFANSKPYNVDFILFLVAKYFQPLTIWFLRKHTGFQKTEFYIMPYVYRGGMAPHKELCSSPGDMDRGSEQFQSHQCLLDMSHTVHYPVLMRRFLLDTL